MKRPSKAIVRPAALVVWATATLAALSVLLHALVDDGRWVGIRANVSASAAFLLFGALNVGAVALAYRRREPSPRARLLIVAFLVVALLVDLAVCWSIWHANRGFRTR